MKMNQSVWTAVLGFATLACLAYSHGAIANQLIVSVTGAETDTGEIGCALFDNERGFPLDTSDAMRVWQTVSDGGAECRFDGLVPGKYAVAVSHDLNGNRETDTNIFGIPTEAWGVSNNVRPKLRAPRFDEATFNIADGESVAITVEIIK